MTQIPTLPAPPPTSELTNFPSESPDNVFAVLRRYPAHDVAQEIVLEAWQQDEPVAAYELCLQALATFPFSIDAYTTLGNIYKKDYKELDQALAAYRYARECSLALWPELEELDEMPWAISDFRPYLRTLHGLACLYDQKGEKQAAIDLFRHLLRVNASDNFDCRQALFTILIGQGSFQEADELLTSTDGDLYLDNCPMRWGLCLMEYQRHGQGSCSNEKLETCLAKALAYNSFVPDWLLSTKPLPDAPSQASYNSPAEALVYAIDAKNAWTAANGAIEWLASSKARSGPYPKDDGQILFDLLTRGRVRIELRQWSEALEITTNVHCIKAHSQEAFAFPSGTKEHDPSAMIAYDLQHDSHDTIGDFVRFPYHDVVAVYYWDVLHSYRAFGQDHSWPCCHCYANSAKLRCSRCKAVWYCSSACQKRHWKEQHKRDCERWIKR